MTVFDEFAIEDRKIESVARYCFTYTSNFILEDKTGGVVMPYYKRYLVIPFPRIYLNLQV